MLLGLMGLFGMALIGFALIPVLPIALLLLGVVGLAGAAIDALVQTLLQDNVHGSARGSAMGVWVTALGFGPIGQIEIGALAVAFGPGVAQVINAIVVVVAASALAVGSRLRTIK